MTLAYTSNTAVPASYKVGIDTVAPSPALIPENWCITKHISEMARHTRAKITVLKAPDHLPRFKNTNKFPIIRQHCVIVHTFSIMTDSFVTIQRKIYQDTSSCNDCQTISSVLTAPKTPQPSQSNETNIVLLVCKCNLEILSLLKFKKFVCVFASATW